MTINVGAGTVIGNNNGINAQNNGTGALSITTTGGVTGNAGYGIAAGNFGTGALSITTTGDVTGNVTGNFGAGIYAFNYQNGTDLTINAATVTGSYNGIKAVNNGSGVLRITTTGVVTATEGIGIVALSDRSGPVLRTNEANATAGANSMNTLTVEAGSLVQGGTSAIYAYTGSASSTMSIFNHGAIQNLSTLSTDLAITTAGPGATIITNTGLITGRVELGGNSSVINDNTWNTAGGMNLFVEDSSVTNNAGGTIITANAFSALPVTTNFNFNSRGTFTNAGVITMRNGVAGDTTVITGNFVGVDNGQIWMDTMLGGSLSPTDQLVLDRGRATGSTALFINNAGGFGAMTTGDGIKVVDAINGATTTSSAFTLGNSLIIGAYDYNLLYGGVGAHALDQNWYLRSSYRNEVPVNMVAPVLAQRFGLTMLDTLDDRVGSKVVDGQEGNVNAKSGVWLRIIGQTGDRTNGHDADDFTKNGPSYRWNMGGIQGGYDLYRDTHENKSSDVVGLDFGYGHMNANVDQVYSSSKAGNLSMNGYSVAAYWTHYVANGWYTDAVLQGTGLDNIRTQSVNGQNLSTNGYGYLASLETGWKLDYSNQVSFTPEAQVVYQSVNLSRKADAYALFNFNASDSTYARIGGRVSKTWEAGGLPEGMITWGRVNVWHNFNDEANTTISTLSGLNPVTLGADLGNSWAQFSLGASRRVNHGLTLFTSGDLSTFFAGSNGQFWSGRLGAKYVY